MRGKGAKEKPLAELALPLVTRRSSLWSSNRGMPKRQSDDGAHHHLDQAIWATVFTKKGKR